MALVLSIDQLLQMGEGTVPEAFKGTVKKVWDPQNGTRKADGQAWKMQKVILTDGKNDIECVFDNWNDDIPRSVQGKQMYAESYMNGKNGRSGLKRKVNTYTDAQNVTKTTQQVKIFSGATVTFEGASQQHTQQPQPQTQQRQNVPPHSGSNGNHASNGNGHANGNGNGHKPAANGSTPPAGGIVDKAAARAQEMKTFDKKVAKTVAAYGRNFDAAVKFVKDIQERYPELKFSLTSNEYKELATTLFVNSCWTVKPADIENFPLQPFHLIEAAQKKAAEAATPAATQNHNREGAPFTT